MENEYTNACNGFTNVEPFSKADQQNLRVSRNEYRFLCELGSLASRKGHYELAAEFYASAGAYATMYHPGFFSDSNVENEIFRIGQEWTSKTCSPTLAIQNPPHKGTRSWLHVFSGVAIVGGNTSTLVNWIRNDRQSQHKIVLTRQVDTKLAEWLRDTLEPFGVEVVALDPQLSLLQRAAQLRCIASGDYDACIVQASPSDIIPILAFASNTTPPVAYIDHSDHTFWMGATVADLIIHQRPIGFETCCERRAARACHLLPIPLASQPLPPLRAEVRERLGIPLDAVVALTVGREIKYRPTPTRNFFRSAAVLLQRHRNLLIHCVGVSRESALKWAPDLSFNRIVFHGEVPVDPDLRVASDLYLESYPFGSQTAMLEAALAGLAPVRAPRCGTMLLATSDSSIDAVVEVPSDEDGYLRCASRLINVPSYRESIGAKVQRQVAGDHSSEGWREHLSSLYKKLERLEHTPAPIRRMPQQECITDAVLHRWNRTKEAGPVGNWDLRILSKAFVNSCMETFCQRRDFRLLPTIASVAMMNGRGDRTILKMGLSAAVEQAVDRSRSFFQRSKASKPTDASFHKRSLAEAKKAG